MNLLIIGAAGETGRLAVERAVAAGHAVTAFVHDPSDYSPPAGVRVVGGDAQDATKLAEAVAGQDAVLDAIGGHTPYLKTDLERNVARSVVEAMSKHGVRKLVVISMLGVGDSEDQAGFFYEHLLMPTFLRGATPDKEAMESAVEQGGVDYVIVRPPLLTHGEATGKVRVVAEGEKAGSITRADLAAFLVDQLASDQYAKQAVTVENG